MAVLRLLQVDDSSGTIVLVTADGPRVVIAADSLSMLDRAIHNGARAMYERLYDEGASLAGKRAEAEALQARLAALQAEIADAAQAADAAVDDQAAPDKEAPP